MADFKTHITTSTVCGIGLGATAYLGFDYPLDQCVLAAGLCSVSGMLPDLDSDNGVPVRETFAFAAAIIPMLMIERFQHMGLSVEQMVLSAEPLFLAVVGKLLAHWCAASLPLVIFAPIAALALSLPVSLDYWWTIQSMAFGVVLFGVLNY